MQARVRLGAPGGHVRLPAEAEDGGRRRRRGALRSGSNGALILRNSSADATVTSSTGVTLGVWHELQLRARIGAGAETEVWLGGVRIASLSRPQALGDAGVGRLQLGDDTAGRAYDIAFDDVLVDEPTWPGWNLGG